MRSCADNVYTCTCSKCGRNVFFFFLLTSFDNEKNIKCKYESSSSRELLSQMSVSQRAWNSTRCCCFVLRSEGVKGENERGRNGDAHRV